MKNLKTIATALLMLFGAITFAQKNDLQASHLKGNVQWVKKYSYSAIVRNDKVDTGSRQLYYLTTYNKNGYIEKKVQAFLFPVSEYESAVTTDSFVYTKIDNTMTIRKYSRGETELGEKKSMEKTIKRYDTKGNMVERKEYDKNNRLKYTWTYNYDKKGYIISGTRDFHDASGQVKRAYFTHKNDQNGNALEITYLDASKKYASKTVFE